jgi:predicted nuclease with RNAse H fold
MLHSNTIFIGLDTSAGQHPCTLAALDDAGRLQALMRGEVGDALAFIGEQERAVVAVNAPAQLSPGKRQVRACDAALRAAGIMVTTTPTRVELCPAWMQSGFALYRGLEQMGGKVYPVDAPVQFFESHPLASFQTLLGHMPFAAHTLEGRLQRQLVLFERGLRIADPMDFFEEITRHRLLRGALPLEHVLEPDALDALVAAFTARVSAHRPAELAVLGNLLEQVILPARVSALS